MLCCFMEVSCLCPIAFCGLYKVQVDGIRTTSDLDLQKGLCQQVLDMWEAARKYSVATDADPFGVAGMVNFTILW